MGLKESIDEGDKKLYYKYRDEKWNQHQEPREYAAFQMIFYVLIRRAFFLLRICVLRGLSLVLVPLPVHSS